MRKICLQLQQAHLAVDLLDHPVGHAGRGRRALLEDAVHVVLVGQDAGVLALDGGQPVGHRRAHRLLKDAVALPVEVALDLGKALAALICIEIENAESFTRIGNAEQIFKRLLERILTSIDKQYSFACGKNNNQYWLFIPEIESYKKLVTEVEHLKGLFDAPIEEEFLSF